MKANDKQVAGEHYQGDIQPWDAIIAWELGFLDGCAVKYLARWRKKGGVQDIMKAIHFLEKLVEVENDRLQRTHTRNPEASEGVPQTAIEASVSGRFDYSRAFTSGSKTTLECNQGGFTPRSLGDII